MTKIVEVELRDSIVEDERITFSVGPNDVVVYIGIEELRTSRESLIQCMSLLNQALKSSQ